jgi:hypothetical protein
MSVVGGEAAALLPSLVLPVVPFVPLAFRAPAAESAPPAAPIMVETMREVSGIISVALVICCFLPW